jgi:nitrate reductase NapD
MPDELHIASLVVHAHPTRADAVRRAIAAIGGAEIHAEENGKLVVTLEARSDIDIADRFTAISRLDGVLAASPVYHHAEPSEDTP